MIQTEIRNHRNEVEPLDHNDPRYWEGPYKYEPFPKAVYRVTQPGQTEPECRIVRSDRELAALPSDWKESPADAKAHFETVDAEIARAAAEANYTDQRMSASARAEKLAHERSTEMEMVTDVPAPKKKPGRKPKPQPVPAE